MVAIVAMTLLALSRPFVAAHHPMVQLNAEVDRHAELALPSVDDGNHHYHADGLLSEQQPSHQHGHFATDHSHETAVVARLTSQYDARHHGWYWAQRMVRYTTPAYRFERPPKRLG